MVDSYASIFSEKMTVSVIIPTYNGVNKILLALRSLEVQSRMPDEVVVVVDGSTDGTVDLLKQQTFKFEFKLIEQANSGRAKVRNRGVSEASSELLLFLDDDMIAGDVLIEKHLLHHKEKPGSILTGGLREPDEGKRSDFYQFKSYLNDKWNTSLVELEDRPMSEADYFITAGNCSVSKGVFAALEGFDERLKDAEDYDLAVRAWNMSVPMYFSAQAYAYHKENVNCLIYIKRIRQYEVAQRKLSAIKPDLYAGMHKQAIQLPTGVKKVFFNLFTTKWWINSVDRKCWTWLPEKVRFKLYDIIVTANGVYFPDRVIL